MFTTLRIHSCWLLQGAFRETEAGGAFPCKRLFLIGYQHEWDIQPLRAVRWLSQLTYLEYDGKVDQRLSELAGAWPDLVTLNLPAGQLGWQQWYQVVDYQCILSTWPKLQHLHVSNIPFVEEGLLNLAPLRSLTVSMMLARDLARLPPPGASTLVRLRVVGICVERGVTEEQMMSAVTRLLEYGALGDTICLSLDRSVGDILGPLGELAHLARTVYVSGHADQWEMVGQVLGARVRTLLVDSLQDQEVVGHLRHFSALKELYICTNNKDLVSWASGPHPQLKVLKLVDCYSDKERPPQWVHHLQDQLGVAVKVVWLELGLPGIHEGGPMDKISWCQRVLDWGCRGLMIGPGPLAHPWSLPNDHHGLW